MYIHSIFHLYVGFNAHINVTYHKTICRLQPTTSHHIVEGFKSSHVYRRRTFPTFNPSTWRYVYVHFEWPCYSNTFTYVTHSKSETLKGPGSPCHYIPYQAEDGLLCRHTMPARRVVCDILAHFKFIVFMCNFFLFITFISDGSQSWVSRLHLNAKADSRPGACDESRFCWWTSGASWGGAQKQAQEYVRLLIHVSEWFVWISCVPPV